MFMSTRYKKKTELPSKQTLLFSKDDSLAKLFEFLTLEFSCSKLITPKWKDFRSQKLKFDQKTRLNNAIWRAWHVQYKLDKKARFFQFAAPFSDETQHSTSQAVILDGKYWKKRLDVVSREYKKWRRMYKEKLLKHSGATKQELEESEEEDLSEGEETDDGNTQNTSNESQAKHKSQTKPSAADRSINSIDSWSAMYALSDTLFSSCDSKKTIPIDNSLLFYKDSSVMIQPTIDHLNPCFDELLENFDFLFSELSSNNNQPVVENQDPMLMQGASYNAAPAFTGPYLPLHTPKKQMPPDIPVVDESQNKGVIFPQHHHSKNIPQKMLLPDYEQKNNYEELPPQLQAPNLAAHLQATMKKPTLDSIRKVKSDPAFKRGLKQENSGVPTKKTRRNTHGSSSSITTAQKVDQPLFFQNANKTQDKEQHDRQVFVETPVCQPDFAVAPERVNSQTPVVPTVEKPIASIAPSTVLTSPSAVSLQGITSNLSGASAMASAINEQQLITLASILQCSQPSQSTESTLAYIELLQQQLQLLLKQQQEQLALKYQIQQHAEKVMKQQQSGPSQQQQSSLSQQQIGPSHQQTDNSQHLRQHSELPKTQNFAVPKHSIPAQVVEQIQQQYPQPIHQHKKQHFLYHEITNQDSQQKSQQMPPARHQQQHITHKQPALQPELTQHQFSQPRQHITPYQQPKPAKQQLYIQPDMFHQQQKRAQEIRPHFSHTQPQQPTEAALPPVHQSISPQASPMVFSAPPKIAMVKTASDHSNKLFYEELLPAPHPSTTESVVPKDTIHVPKQHSLIKTLHRKLDYNPREISYEAAKHIRPSNKPSGGERTFSLSSGNSPIAGPSMVDWPTLHPNTEQRLHPFPRHQHTLAPTQQKTPTTMDSAMALVSLAHTKPSTSTTSEVTINQASDRQYDFPETDKKQTHLTAEQKRRNIIKNAFEELGSILPPNTPGQQQLSRTSNKLTNASILQKSCNHIHFLKENHRTVSVKVAQLKQNIEGMKQAINECQRKMPDETGEVSNSQESARNCEKRFIAYCKEMIFYNPKYWIFCVIMRPLFDSFNSTVITKTVDTFVNSIMSWLERHCNLSTIRSIVLNTFTKLSTSTSLLDDPKCLDELVQTAQGLDDPTQIFDAKKRR